MLYPGISHILWYATAPVFPSFSSELNEGSLS
jgi:hypothetical protein